jgi:hypothetical protein
MSLSTKSLWRKSEIQQKKRHIIDWYLFWPMNCPLKAPLFGEIEVKGTQSTRAARESAGKLVLLPCKLQSVGGPAEPARYIFGDFRIAFATVTLREGA